MRGIRNSLGFVLLNPVLPGLHVRDNDKANETKYSPCLITPKDQFFINLPSFELKLSRLIHLKVINRENLPD